MPRTHAASPACAAHQYASVRPGERICIAFGLSMSGGDQLPRVRTQPAQHSGSAASIDRFCGKAARPRLQASSHGLCRVGILAETLLFAMACFYDSDSSSIDMDVLTQNTMERLSTAFTLPLTASERALLKGLEPSDGDCAECASSSASATAAVHQFAAPSSRSSIKDKRGGYSREPDENGVRKGVRPKWVKHCSLHIDKAQTLTICTTPCCKLPCPNDGACMDVAFTPATLKRCALLVFGGAALEGKAPPSESGNHAATQ
eukprot:1984016-Pleurochrysis_carterae.AAC.1